MRRNRLLAWSGFRVVIVFNVAKWKRSLLRKYKRSCLLIFLPLDFSEELFTNYLAKFPRLEFLVWGMRQPKWLQRYADEYNIPIERVEDGFVRSIGLGAEKVLPWSLCFDRSGIYFDATKPSDLENLLNTYDFAKDRKLMLKTQACLELFRKYGVSKYNQDSVGDILGALYGPKTKRRLLVLGQVEDDQSLIFGCNPIMSNAEFLQRVIDEHPDAQIIYKPHPDYLAGKRFSMHSLDNVEGDYFEIPMATSLKSSLIDVDAVCVMTSLGGFEALLYGVPVVTYGLPFYAGWGVTTDKIVCARRSRQLSVEQVFAAAYILYPRYLVPDSLAGRVGVETDLTSVMSLIEEHVLGLKNISREERFDIPNYYNLGMKSVQFSTFLLRRSCKKMAVVTDTDGAMTLAQVFAKHNKQVDVLTLLDQQARSPYLTPTVDELDLLRISSLPKTYGVPFSEIESQSVSLSAAWSDIFANFFREADLPLGQPTKEAFQFDFEDFLYNDGVRFLSSRKILEDFDSVVLHFDDFDKARAVSKSVLYFAKEMELEGKVNFTVPSRLRFDDALDTLVGSHSVQSAVKDGMENFSARLKSFFWSVQHHFSLAKHAFPNSVFVVGNVSERNYAYSPAALRSLSLVTKICGAVLVHPSLGSTSLHDEIKDVVFGDVGHKNCYHFQSSIAKYKAEFSELASEIEWLAAALYCKLISKAEERFSRELIDAFSERIKVYCDSFIYKLIFALELEHISERCMLLITTLDRSLSSMLLASFMEDQGRCSVGLQPQIISNSPRYRAAKLSKLGVIDSNQRSIFSGKGMPLSEIYPVGSVNIADRLLELRQHKSDAKVGGENKKTVLFAMQHSTETEMLSIARALKNIMPRLDCYLWVKPHPHQEPAVFNKVRSIFYGVKNVDVLAVHANTYKYLAQADVVVGLFSSVLYESALSNIPVVVADFFGLNDSVDFASKGLAYKADNEELLYDTLQRILSGELDECITASLSSYQKDNPQFYTENLYSAFDEFVCANISDALQKWDDAL